MNSHRIPSILFRILPGRLVACLILGLLAPDLSARGAASWVHTARIAGLGIHETASDAEIRHALEALKAQGVNVVEADTSLSDYLSEEEFAGELAFIERVVNESHHQGLRVVWYYPTLEVITPDGRIADTSMQREHPDWVQKNFDRRSSNFFFGTKAFWVEPNDESAWMCPNSPYRDFYLGRVRRLAATGMDGLWLDVPLFNSIVGRWPCTGPYCQRKFREATGHELPERLDFTDPVFRRWLVWRHQTLADFLEDVRKAAADVDPQLKVIVEVVSCDHIINTLEGLDATYFTRDLDIVWEVDAISDTTSMVHASRDDWLSMMAVYAYCRGASQDRARWVFTYGHRPDDAQMVMAAAVMFQCNPYETRIPQMVTSVGEDYRKRMFRWLEKHSKEIFESTSAARVALLYSSSSRDFLDGHRSGGFYVSPQPPDPAFRWWVKSPEMSILRFDYLAEYRGFALLFLENHIPFDALCTNQLEGVDLDTYRAVILPEPRALSDQALGELKAYVARGGHVLFTGGDVGALDDLGVRREAPLVSTKSASWTRKPHERGTFTTTAERPGARFHVDRDPDTQERVITWLRSIGVAGLLPRSVPVAIQSYARQNRLILHVVNTSWLGSRPLTPRDVEVPFRIPLPGRSADIQVTGSIPGRKESVVPHREEDGWITFSLKVRHNALVQVRFGANEHLRQEDADPGQVEHRVRPEVSARRVTGG